MTTSSMKTLPGLFLLLSLSACMEEFEPASRLAGPRVLGAKVTVAGDESRSTPAPGETATIDWILAAPGALPSLSWGFVACSDGACAIAATGTGLPVRFPWTVPLTTAAPRVQVQGRICEDGAVALVDGIPACEGGGKGTTVTVDVVLATADTSNRNPELAGRVFTLDGLPWIDGEDCADLPGIALGTKGHVLAVRMLAADREAYTGLAGDPPTPTPMRETLQISNFATDGTLSHTFSFIEPEVADAETEVAITWDAPTTPPVTGDRVTFHFVARDLRGGVAVATRSLCLR